VQNVQNYLAFSPEAKCAEEDTLEFSAKNAVDDEVHFKTKEFLSCSDYQKPQKSIFKTFDIFF
jgi:hypothetical protein